MKTQVITKKDLKMIHDVACSSWKTKLEQYANRKPFDDEITLTQTEINEMFEAADSAQKKVLNKFFKPESLDIMTKVTDYKTACEVLGISDNEPRSAYERLCIIIKALNEGWWPNFNNTNEYKYWNYFYMKDSVFSYYGRNCYYTTHMYVPSALYLKSRDLADYAVKIAFEEYKETYTK